jgi:uncharacterized membrane protein
MSESQLIDGPGGAERSPAPVDDPAGFRRLLPTLVATTVVVSVLGFLQKTPCMNVGFDFGRTVRHACYTDIYPLYFGRGLADGKVPYLDKVPEPVEYPVLTGGFMHVVAVISRWFGGDASSRGMVFYKLTAVGLVICALVTVLATAYVAGRRRGMRTGLMVAASPALLLAAYINWDLLAVALGALAVAFWARRQPVLAGVMLGLATAAKFYPILFLGPLFLLCLRAGRLREFARTVAGALIAWLVVNVPIMVLAFSSWSRFYTFNQQRPVDWGSTFFMLRSYVKAFAIGDVPKINLAGELSFVVLALAVGVLIMVAPRRPRLPQVLFLVTAAFLLTNKVWSPQYVLWLLPLAALARPKLPAYLVWQAGEILYFFSIWWLLLAGTLDKPADGLESTWHQLVHFHTPLHGITVNVYYVGLLARFLTVLLLCALIVVDILVPRFDMVRADGVDDPAGGVLDDAEDRFVLRWPRRAAAPQAA